MAIVDFVPPDSWIRIRGYPNTGEIVRMDFVIDELSETVFVNVYAACLAVMDLAMDDRRISTGLNFETSDPIVVDVVGFKVTLK